MKTIQKLFISFIFLTCIEGCANYRTQEHFERNPTLLEDSRAPTGQLGRATVYYFRQKAWMQELIYIPIPPFFYAVDGRMLSIMPLASHAVLSLEPGRHRFSRLIVSGWGAFAISVDRVDVDLTVTAGETYFVGSRNGLSSSPFEVVDPDRGRAIVADTNLVKILHQPVSVDTFIDRVASQDRKAPSSAKASPQASKQRPQVNISSALPSSQQVGEFLEVVATVALVAVLLFGVAAGASMAPPSLPSPNLMETQPPSISVQAPTQSVAIEPTLRTSSGSMSEILRSTEETTLRNLSTGVRYRIEDGKITGTDGSQYRVVGSTVYSDTGQSYQVIGNNIFASDGSSCVKTGTLVSCR